MGPLETRLLAHRKQHEQQAARCWLPLDLCSRSDALAERKPAATRLRIAASAETPYIVVKKTLSKVGYPRVSFLVSDEQGRVRRLNVGWGPFEEWDDSGDTCFSSCKRHGPL